MRFNLQAKPGYIEMEFDHIYLPSYKNFGKQKRVEIRIDTFLFSLNKPVKMVNTVLE